MTSSPETPLRSPRGKVILLVVTAGCFTALGVMLASSQTSKEFAVGAGVLGSLVASLLALIVRLFVLDEPRGDGPAAAEQLEQAVSRLAASTQLIEQGEQHGVATIKPKDRYTPEEWIQMLTDAHHGLFFVGHALDKWCQEGIRPHFIAAIRRLIEEGKAVRFLMLPLNGDNTDRITEQRGLDYRKRLRKTLCDLASIRNALTDDRRHLLDVRMLRGDVVMPYMVVGNERRLITATYPVASQLSGAMLAATVSSKSRFGMALRQDVDQLLQQFADHAPLDE